MPSVKSKLFDVYLALWTLLLSAAVPFLALRGDARRIRRVSRLWSNGIVFGLRHIVGLSHREIGIENRVPGPALYICNHQSAWETLVFNVLIPDVAIVLKEQLYRFPVVGWFLRRSPMIAVDRGAGARAMKVLLREAEIAIGEGRSVLIFPEGTRQPVDADGPFNRGIVLLYKNLKVPVVPVAINSGLYWSRQGFMKRQGVITVSYLPAVAAGLTDDDFMARVKAAIGTEKARLAHAERDLPLSALGQQPAGGHWP
jgi:1-acyl-sn-glycerol-3-phosphate acyltransferase